MRRLEGVGNVKVDLKAAEAVLRPAPGKSFDPLKIPKAVKDAGFTPGEIQVTAAGTLERRSGSLALVLPGAPPELLLRGGAKTEELAGKAELAGKRIRVTGKLRAGRAPELTVEQWSPAG